MEAHETPPTPRRVKWNWRVPTGVLVTLAAGAILLTASVAVLCVRP